MEEMYDILDLDVEECIEWIIGMKKCKGVDMELEVTYESFRDFIKGKKKSKTSFPIGRFYGHYKALNEDGELCRLAFDNIYIAVSNGIVLERWKTVHQLLLLKDPPKMQIHKLQNITLFEVDLMYVMKHVWAKTLAERIYNSGKLNKSQYARQ